MPRPLLNNILCRLEIACQPNCFEAAYDVPSEIDLPPAATEPSRIRIRVMVPVPVLAPCPQLQRAEPPYVSTRVRPLGQPRRHMQQAIDEHLKVQSINQPDSANPEEGLPPENQP